MHALSAIFLDTCILESEQFDFGSPQLKALVAATKGKALNLVLPHATQLEIERHIETKIDAAITALKTVRKDHPFLRELGGFPHSRAERDAASRELEKKFSQGWRSFKKKFGLVELDYSTIDLHEVMGWYDRQEVPFGAGGKRKEFPDAFVFSSLRSYARDQKVNIAVVSSDNDFRDACTTVSQLHHFPSLASLTNALLKEEARFETAVSIAQSATALFTERITENFPDRAFYHEIDPDSKSHVQDVEVTQVDINPARIEIIGLGHEAFTVSFRATVRFTAWAQHVDADSWVSLGDGDVMYLHRCKGTVEDEAEIDCIARVSTDDGWQAAKRLLSLQIENDFITVSATAPEVDEREPEDYLD